LLDHGSEVKNFKLFAKNFDLVMYTLKFLIQTFEFLGSQMDYGFYSQHL
jgi:hypothetical protein